MADHGPHSLECAQAVSGTCHCDCHGTMHGVAHLPHRKHEPGTTITHIGGGAYHVVASTGLPPGGGTKDERRDWHAAQVAVSGSHHDATPTAPQAYGKWSQRLVEFAQGSAAARANAGDIFRQKFDHLAEYNKIADLPAEHFHALTTADQTHVTTALNDLLASTRAPAAHSRIAGTLHRFTGQETAPLVEAHPQHIQDVMNVLAGKPARSGLPQSYLFAGVSRDSYQRSFTPEQRAQALARLTSIRAGMRGDSRDVAGVDRAIADLRSIDGHPDAGPTHEPHPRPGKASVTPPTTPEQTIARRAAEVKVTAATDSPTALADRIRQKEAELADAQAAVSRHWSAGTPGTSSMRGKQHGQRVDANVRRGAQLADSVQRVERELASLREQATAASNPPQASVPLEHAKFVRTQYGWYEVLKVNASSVKVKAAPGMDDLIKKTRILEAR